MRIYAIYFDHWEDTDIVSLYRDQIAAQKECDKLNEDYRIWYGDRDSYKVKEYELNE